MFVMPSLHINGHLLYVCLCVFMDSVGFVNATVPVSYVLFILQFISYVLMYAV